MGITSIAGSWEDAYSLANAVVAQMTLDEKIGIVTGTGQLNPKRSSVWFLLPHSLNL
jgi:beta-glucosidase